MDVLFVKRQRVVFDLLGNVQIRVRGDLDALVSKTLGHVFYVCAGFEQVDCVCMTQRMRGEDRKAGPLTL